MYLQYKCEKKYYWGIYQCKIYGVLTCSKTKKNKRKILQPTNKRINFICSIEFYLVYFMSVKRQQQKITKG